MIIINSAAYMDIENINYKKVEKEYLIKCLLASEKNIPDKNAIKSLKKRIEDSILKGDYIIARNSLIVSIYYFPDITFELIRKKGLFRYSRYVYKRCIVKSLAIELLDICDRFNNCSIEVTTYLNSIINFSTILDSYVAIDRHIINEFKAFDRNYKNKSIIKTILSATDFLFVSHHHPKAANNLSDISNRPKEDISSAASFLIHLYTSRIKHSNVKTSFINEDYIKGQKLAKLFIAACYYSDFKEFEIMIDHFGYTCEKTDTSLYIKPPYEDFEKSIRAGYIRTEIQLINDIIGKNNEALSFEEFVEKITTIGDFKFFKLTETLGYPRYRMEFPEPVFELIIEKFFKPTDLFKEEVIYLSQIFKEQLLTPYDLENIKIKDDLTLFDFIKVRRVFSLFYLIFTKEIYKIEKLDTNLLLRSLVPVYTADQLYKIFEKLIPNKLDSFLDILCWEPGLDIVFDLQYQPILYIDDKFLIPLSIFSNSNYIRNLFASQYKQANSKVFNSGDSLIRYLSSTFIKISIPAYEETQIGTTDIDVFAIINDTLFVFECKHSLHPISSYDLRTTYDYIKKAEKQLDKINESFHSGNLLKIIERKHNIDTQKITRIISCIVISNRLFNGNAFKYPIRNINELTQMLTKGVLRTEFGTFNVWMAKNLTLEFLVEYLSLNNKLTTLLMDSLSKQTASYEFADPKIEFDTYYLESEVATLNLKKFTEQFEKIDNE
jgi:hypothetical protein